MGPFVAQGLAALLASLVMLNVGIFFGWVTVSLPKLLRQNTSVSDESELRITPNEGSWVISISSLAAIFGPIMSNLVVDRIGRKWSLIMITLPMLISWLIVGSASSVKMLYVGRLIGGLSVGPAHAVLPMYLGEIAEDKIRGILGIFMVLSPIIGHLMSYCIGPWVSRAMLCAVSAITLIIFLMAFPWMPETPHFWLMKGSPERAAASLMWLRRRSNVKAELSSIEMIVIEERKIRDGSGITRLFRTPGNRRAFIISMGLISLQQFSGSRAIGGYTSLIFERFGPAGWSNLSLIMIGIIQLLTVIGVLFVIDNVGRCPILMLSSLFTSFFLICEAVFFHLKYLGDLTSSFSWIPLAGIAGFNIAAIPGLGCIPWLMISELFPTEVKAPATMLLAIYSSLMGFLVEKMYEPTVTALGIHWVYYIFGITTLSGVVFVYVCVPETKKLSFEEIQEKLNFGRSIDSKNPIDHSCHINAT